MRGPGDVGQGYIEEIIDAANSGNTQGFTRADWAIVADNPGYTTQRALAQQASQPAPQPQQQPQQQQQPGPSAQDSYYAWLKSQAEQNAIDKTNRDLDTVKSFFTQYGMENLWQGAEKLVRQGYQDPETIMNILSKDASYQEAYYARFPAVKEIRDLNKQRQASGLPLMAEPLPSTYVSLEKAYRQAVAGLPGGLYGSTKDITAWIVRDVSPTEVQGRVDRARNYINYSANDAIKQELRQIYGLTDAEMVSYVLDPERSLGFIETEMSRRMASATVGGAARSAGLGIADLTRDAISQNEQFGSSFANTLAQFNEVRQNEDAYNRLGRLSGVATSADDLVTEQFGLEGAGEVTSKKRKLASQERARFAGSSALTRSSLSAGRLAQ